MAYGTQYAFGVFFAALLDEFGWSRASLSGVFSLYAFTYAAFALVSGRLTDRWGPRVVIAIGGVLLGLGLIAMSRVSRAVAALRVLRPRGRARHVHRLRAVQRHRGEVVHAPPRPRDRAGQRGRQPRHLRRCRRSPTWLVSRLGWRWAYVVFGVAVIVALNALAVLMRRDPETLGLGPDGDARTAGARRRARTAGRRAGRCGPAPSGCSSRCSAATWIPVFVPLVHLVPMARELGVLPAAGRDAGQRAGRRRAGRPPAHGGRVGPDRAAGRPRGGARAAGRRLRRLRAGARAARALRGVARLRLLLRRRLDPLPRRGRRLLRPRAGRRASSGCSSRWPGPWPRGARSRPASSTIAPATTSSRGGSAPASTRWPLILLAFARPPAARSLA